MKQLTERENALRVILHQGDPEWVPVLADCYDTVFPSLVAENPPFGQSGEDWFGCKWLWDQQSFAHGPDFNHPYLLEDITQWRECVKFPDLDAMDWDEAAVRDTANCDRENRLTRLFCLMGPFERINEMMGMEGAFVAMYEQPEEYKALIEALGDFKIKLMEKLIDAYKPDEIFFQDDLGGANGPLISPVMYRELIKPTHKRITDYILERGVLLTYHSCGHMSAFIDDLLDLNPHMINPLQHINDWKAVAEKYKDKPIGFTIGCETRANYPETTDEMLVEDVRELIDTFGPHKNLIVDCFISNMACMPKRDILLDEARSYGKAFYSE